MKYVRDTPETRREAFAHAGPIEAIPRPCCPLCERGGREIYQGLTDWLFGVPGTWNLCECRLCGILWLNPTPVPEDIPKLYARYYTHTADSPTVFQTLRLDIRQHVLARMGYEVVLPDGILPRLLSRVPAIARASALDVMGLPATKIGRLLDVGCGSGELIGRMGSLGWKVAGVDPDPVAVQRGRDSGLDIQQGSISDLPESELYDVITLNHVIEHVPYPIALLRECRKRLNPNGIVLITTPNIVSFGHKWFKQYWRGLEVPRHLLLFSPSSLSQCVVRSGLHVRSIRTETRLARMIFVPSVCAKGRERGVGERSDFPLRTKCASYLFQFIEDGMLYFAGSVGEEVYCACSLKDGNGCCD